MVYILGVYIIMMVSWWNLPQYTESEAIPYIEEYVADARKYGVEVDLTRVNYIGYTKYEMEDTLGVGMPPNIFFTSGVINKELVYHELTHAIFWCYGHEEGVGHIMSEHGWVKYRDWEQEVARLFTVFLKEDKCLRGI